MYRKKRGSVKFGIHFSCYFPGTDIDAVGLKKPKKMSLHYPRRQLNHEDQSEIIEYVHR